jgi:hypothetical protein
MIGNRFGLVVVAAAAIVSFTANTLATWSIILIDTRTGEIAVGSATCLTSFDLKAGTPVLIPGYGAATAQSSVDSTGQNRVLIRDELVRGTDPDVILSILDSFDSSHQSRQYGIVDTAGRAATFTGDRAGPWAGGVTGRVGTIVYAVQGNVLTGEPVVDLAVEAIIHTPGGVPERLMAAMEAARSMGGDGRCSCDPRFPDSCGSPPPDFEKAAHIAYMLIARLGDTPGCNGRYDAGSSPYGIVSRDIDGDGRMDLAVAGAAGVAVLLNTTQPHDPFVTFAPPVLYGVGASPRGITSADLNGDHLEDLIVTNANDDTISVLMALPGGTFAQAVASPVGDSPQNLVTADFDGANGTDIAVTNMTGDSVSILLNDGTGVLVPHAMIATGNGAQGIASADLNNDGAADLVVANRFDDTLSVLTNDGSGSFSIETIPVGDVPGDVAAFDADHDGDDDLAVAYGGDNAVGIFINDTGVLTETVIAVDGAPGLLDAADINNDGEVDLGVLTSASRELVVLLGSGDGSFMLADRVPTGAGNTDLVMADLDGDGDADAAATLRNEQSVVIVENDGTFNNGLGCATGDWYLDLNVAFQTQSDPDPVFTLHDQFDQWRADLVGRPDAIHSRAELDRKMVLADGLVGATLTITPLDWLDGPLASAPVSVTVEHAPGSEGASAIGPVIDMGDGTFTAVITGQGVTGHDLLRVTIDDGVRPVALMPETIIFVGDPLADFNGDTVVNSTDFVAFLRAFTAGDMAADLNGDGSVDSADFVIFLAAFSNS